MEFRSFRTGGTFFWTSRVRFSSQGGSHCRLIRKVAVNPYRCEPRLLSVCLLGLRLIWFLVIHALCTLAMRTRSLHVTVGWSQMDFKEQCFSDILWWSAEGSTIKMDLLSLGLTFSSRFYALKILHKAEVLTFPCVDGLLLSAALHLGWWMQRVPICLRSCFLINELYGWIFMYSLWYTQKTKEETVKLVDLSALWENVSMRICFWVEILAISLHIEETQCW